MIHVRSFIPSDFHGFPSRAQQGGNGAFGFDQECAHDAPRRALPLVQPGHALLEPLQRVDFVYSTGRRRRQVQAHAPVGPFHLPRFLGRTVG